jgi:hypothetical protein
MTAMNETDEREAHIEQGTQPSIESEPRSRGTSQGRNTSSILVKSGPDTSRISVPTATLRASWKFLSGRRGRGLSWGRGGGGGIIHQAQGLFPQRQMALIFQMQKILLLVHKPIDRCWLSL